MSLLNIGQPGERVLLMGNEAIARGALEAGVNMVAGYPGTPSSEIIENLSRVAAEKNLYVEWSVNEKVALEVAAAGSFAELRSLCVMKQVGVNVASDFLLHLSIYGTRGGMVLVSCEDPGGLSSTNEGESRPYAMMMEFPVLEPGDFQEAKEMTRWAFELSEKIRNVVMIRSVTRLSHASGAVTLGTLPTTTPHARFRYEGSFLDQMEGPVANLPVTLGFLHGRQQGKLKQAAALFDASPFNRYDGPDRPEVVVITSSACHLYCKEAIRMLDIRDRVGILKLGTTWPLPEEILKKHLLHSSCILVVEEVLPVMENNIKSLVADVTHEIGVKNIHGKKDGMIPSVDELNPDKVAGALAKLLGLDLPAPMKPYASEAERIASDALPERSLTFCPGCPHRASYWSVHAALRLDNRKGFVCGDIGCYTLGIIHSGFNTLKTLHAMGSGVGVASGFGKLTQFGLNQPVMAVCGDSTFFHAVMPALVNAVHNQSSIILVVLDNSGTAMTGFQPHPGLPATAVDQAAPAVSIPKVCEAMGAHVRVGNPFDIAGTKRLLLEMLAEKKGVNVLVLEQICALSPEKKGKKRYEMSVDASICLSDSCGCNRLCTRVFKCPGLQWDPIEKTTSIDEVICVGCGVCGDVCPTGAIRAEEVKQ